MKWQVRSAAPYSRMNDVIYIFSLALFLQLSMAIRLVSHPQYNIRILPRKNMLTYLYAASRCTGTSMLVREELHNLNYY